MQLLAIDIGNTRLSSAVFDGNRMVRRFDAPQEAQAEEFARSARDCAFCVVSRVSRSAAEFEKFLSQTLRFRVAVLSQSDVPFRVHYDGAVGSDRLANALAARRYAPRGAIVIDLGTATHFDIVDERGDFYGGPILAGIQTLHDALSMRIPHLPQEPLRAAQSAVARNTADAMNAGAVYATVGAIEKIIGSIRAQFGTHYPTILTGGNAVHVRSMFDADFEAPDLTLEGISLFGYEAMRKLGVKVA